MSRSLTLTTLLALGLLPIALPSPALGQEAPQVSVQVRGVSGGKLFGRPRRFMSLNVVLQNGSQAASEGTLRVYRVRKPGQNDPEQSLFYERRVTVPGQGRRAETLYYYCQENEPENRLCVVFAPDDGPPPDPVYPPLSLYGRQVSALLLSSRAVSAGIAKRPFEGALIDAPRLPFPVVTAEAVPDALPEHFAGYEPFDAVVVYDLDADDLPAARAQALLDFAAGGGDLLVSFSGRSALPAKLIEALPVVSAGQPTRRRIDGIRVLSPRYASSWARSDEPVLIDQVKPRPGAVVLAGSAATPLVVRGRHGAGWITYLAFPLDAGPVAGRGEAIRAFGARLLRAPREDPEWGVEVPPAPPVEELLLNLSEGIETLEPPSAWIVVPLLLLYVALVAPLNYMVLSRLKRLGVAQLAAGAIAVVFGLLFYGIGLVSKGSDALTTQVAVVELPGAPEASARVETMTGHFSTDRGLGQASAPEGALVGPLASGKDTNREARVIRGPDGVRLEGVTLDTWALRRFRSLRLAKMGHLQASLTLSADGALKGKVANRTALVLRDPVLLFPHGMVQLNQLEADAVQQVARTVPRAQLGSVSVPSLVKRILKDARGRYSVHYGEGAGISIGNAPYGGRIERRILHTLQRRAARVPRLPGHVPALLVAMAETDPGGVTLEAAGERVLERALVVHEVAVATPAGERHSISGSPPTVQHHDARWQPHGSKTGTPPLLEGYGPKTPSEVVLRWQLPAGPDAPLAVEQLTVRFKVDPYPRGQGEDRLVLLEGWSFKRRRWVELADLARLDIEDGKGYWRPLPGETLGQELVHSEAGSVFLRLKNTWTKNVTIEQLVLDAAFKR